MGCRRVLLRRAVRVSLSLSSLLSSHLPAPAGQPADALANFRIASTVVALLLLLGILLAFILYLRRRRSARAARQGTRLGSSSDLVVSVGEFRAGRGEMVQKRRSGTSWTTNSVSTGAGAGGGVYYTQGRGRGEGGEGDSMMERSTVYTSTTGEFASSSSSSSLSASYFEHEEEEEEESPFSDLHAPPRVRTKTRDNLHSRSSFSLGESRGRGSIRSGETGPSSTGATWGREHDSDDGEGEAEGELISLSGSGSGSGGR